MLENSWVYIWENLNTIPGSFGALINETDLEIQVLVGDRNLINFPEERFYLKDILSDSETRNDFQIIKELKEKKCITPILLGNNHISSSIFYRSKNKEKAELLILPLNEDTFSMLLESYGDNEVFERHSGEIVLKVSKDGTILDCNSTANELFGISNPKENSYSLSEFLLTPPDFSFILQRFGNTDIINQMEICFSTSSKDLVGLASIIAIRDQDDEIALVHLYVCDISSRVSLMGDYMRTSIELTMAYEDLKKAQATLVNQEKMASVGQLAAGLAHEINNPLGYISNNFQVLNEYFSSFEEFINQVKEIMAPNPSGLEQLEEIIKECEVDYILEDFPNLYKEVREGVSRIEKLLNSLRFFSQKDSREEFDFGDINQALENLLDLTYNEYKYNIEIKKDFREVPPIYCHMMSLNQALFQLFMNAVQAVEANLKNEEGFISLKTFERNDWVFLQIDDSGGGIPMDMINHLQQPFVTNKQDGSGTGLGFSIIRDVIEKKHKGKIDISNSETGLRILIGLPPQEEEREIING